MKKKEFYLIVIGHGSPETRSHLATIIQFFFLQTPPIPFTISVIIKLIFSYKNMPLVFQNSILAKKFKVKVWEKLGSHTCLYTSCCHDGCQQK